MKNEINDLYTYDYKIVQNPKYFKFSLDSILLAEFVNFNYSDKKMLDMCTGNCPVPIILSSKIKNIVAIEVQEEIYKMGKESIEINDIHNIDLINDNLVNINKYYNDGYFDVITCNPPYFKYEKSSIINDNMVKSIARHEILVSLEEIIKVAYNSLKDKGRLFLVYRPDRLIELIKMLDKYKFGIKKIECCYDNVNSNSSIVLVEAMKNGKDDLKILSPIYTEKYRRNK